MNRSTLQEKWGILVNARHVEQAERLRAVAPHLLYTEVLDEDGVAEIVSPQGSERRLKLYRIVGNSAFLLVMEVEVVSSGGNDTLFMVIHGGRDR